MYYGQIREAVRFAPYEGHAAARAAGSSYFNDLWTATVPRDAPWPLMGQAGLFMDIYDWDTVVVGFGGTHLIATPVVLCTAYFPCALLLDGRGDGVLQRASGGTVSCIASAGCVSIWVRGLRVACDGAWALLPVLVVDCAALRVSNSSFARCAAQTDGGTVKGYGGGAAVALEGSEFVNSRSALNGGAVAMLGGRLSVSNSTFVGCTAAGSGGAISTTQFTPRYGSSEATQVALTVLSSRYTRLRI